MIRDQFRLDLNDELIVDNFAGGGGASTGIELGIGRNVDIAINHNEEACDMHAANHPQTRHYCEDVFSIDPLEVTNGRPVGLAWFSPDCKHFSKAKGGKPRSKKIRGLAWVMIRWAATVSPRVMILENVEEFRTWGPLLADGSPCKKRAGQTFRSFVRQLEKLGYAVEHRELRACDYGAPTIRKRLFLIARRDGRPIVWPEPTHGAPNSEGVRAGRLLPWRTAAECIDWSIPTRSIFERERPLAEATMRRIARGIQKFVIDSPTPFIVKVNHGASEGFRGQSLGDPLQTITSKHGYGMATPFVARVAHGERDKTGKKRGRGEHPTEEPLPTVLASPEFSLVTPFVTEHANSSNQRNIALDEPLRTQCANVKGGHFAVAAATLVQTGYGEREGQAPRAPGIEKPLGTAVAGGQKHAVVSATLIGAGGPTYGGKPKPVDQPHGTMTTENHTALCTAFLAKHQSERHEGEVQGAPLDGAAPTVKTRDSNAIVTANIVRQFGESVGSSTSAPVGTVTAGGGGKTGLVTSHLAKLKGTCQHGQASDEPLHTVQAGGLHYAEVRAFLIKYYGNEKDGFAPTEPMHTVTAKDRVGLVTVGGEDYAIADIGMRMLEPHELYAAQGFPPGYIIAPIINGKRLSKAAQVRMCGNSVCPPIAAALVSANVPELSAWEKGERAA
ncbi:DNA (cytosine-5)-methyltransferase 1 [Terrimicrobium sacchariphilum]|uniref:DNA (cytosine-5-)-methyltransferase n=1 Tax=Terrimicrobium sacchariphilum TaxID=690879 RepID=A0A146GES2_TERSA|nr:DNA cytosine methyltransferase [Terrimicrobium sacchariphilum]GAT35603.1 DNA (cytosine-5)-methyltransferase 1 [Terrimicrobium sacchariphilum]